MPCLQCPWLIPARARSKIHPKASHRDGEFTASCRKASLCPIHGCAHPGGNPKEWNCSSDHPLFVFQLPLVFLKVSLGHPGSGVGSGGPGEGTQDTGQGCLPGSPGADPACPCAGSQWEPHCTVAGGDPSAGNCGFVPPSGLGAGPGHLHHQRGGEEPFLQRGGIWYMGTGKWDLTMGSRS